MSIRIERSYDDDVLVVIIYSETVDKDNGKFTLNIKVDDNRTIPKEIFVYRKNTDGTDSFHSIAQTYMLGDENEFPKTRPVDGYGYYLKDEMEIEYTSASDVITARIDGINQITRLVQNYGVIIKGFSASTEQEISYDEEEDS